MVRIKAVCFSNQFSLTSVTCCNLYLGKGKESNPTDVSANMLADASVDTLLMHRVKYLPFLTVILLLISAGIKNNLIRKDESMKAKF